MTFQKVEDERLWHHLPTGDTGIAGELEDAVFNFRARKTVGMNYSTNYSTADAGKIARV